MTPMSMTAFTEFITDNDTMPAYLPLDFSFSEVETLSMIA